MIQLDGAVGKRAGDANCPGPPRRRGGAAVCAASASCAGGVSSVRMRFPRFPSVPLRTPGPRAPRALHCAPMQRAATCALGRGPLRVQPSVSRSGQNAHLPGVGGARGLRHHGERARIPRRHGRPERVVVRDPYEPWRAPLGFIIPANGRFTETSVPTLLSATGLAVSLRASDTRVPSWGGEILVRVDVLAPAPEETSRWGGDIAFVLDGRGEDCARLPRRRCGQLGARDRIVVVDSSRGRILVPMMPASHRALILAALERRSRRRGSAARRTRPWARRSPGLTQATERRVVVRSADPAGNEEGQARDWVHG